MKKPVRDDDFYPFGLSGRYGSVSPMERPHRHHEVELFLMESGSFLRSLGGKNHRFGEGQILLFWGAYPHQLLEVSPPGRSLIIYVPLERFLRWELDRKFIQKIMNGDLAIISQTRESREIVELLKRRVVGGSLERLSRGIEREIGSQFLRLSEMTESSEISWMARESNAPVNIDQVCRMMKFIIENFHEPIGLKEIGEAAGLHPNYTWALFQRTTGMTLHHYLTTYRLAYAQELLLNTRKKIIDIALESGFGSVSRFYAVFKKFTRSTPSAYRSGIKGAGTES
jgi:AraC-like DNA-binding protein